MRLGPLERDVLAVIKDAPHNAFGSEIFETISEKNKTSKGSVSSVFLVCQRLENKGLLTHTETAPEARRGGRRRKLFALTDLGRSVIENSGQEDEPASTVTNFVKGINIFKNNDSNEVAIVNDNNDTLVVLVTGDPGYAETKADQLASFFKVERISS